MDYKHLSRAERDILLKQELDPDKVHIIEKFGLTSTGRLEWVSEKENAHVHLIFKHSFIRDHDLIAVLFRVYGLCFAKVNYFRTHREAFDCYIHDYTRGFVKTRLWNAEFFKHKASGYMIDVRELQKITKIEDFRSLCTFLESFEKEQR